MMIFVQDHWNEALRSDESIWVTLKKPGEAGVHGRLQVPASSAAADAAGELVGSDGFWARRLDARTLLIGHRSTDTVYSSVLPAAELCSIHSKAVTSIDVTPNGMGVSCSADGTLRIWETANGVVRRELQDHLGEVNTCRFFPSGVVVLSGGQDMQLKIWSAESGQCAATLRGHTAPLQHTAVVDRGRNILSAARDGKCKLWDVGEQRCLADLCALGSPINCILLMDLPDGINGGFREEPPNEREVGTEGKLVVVGSDDGWLRLIHVYTRTEVYSAAALPAAVTALCSPRPGELVAGCRDGTVVWLELGSGLRRVREERCSGSAVHALLAVQGTVLAARADGSVHSVGGGGQEVVTLSGPDCESVYALSAAGDALFTAARDGCVRRYRLPLSC